MSDQGFVVYTTMFVHYDDDGKVHLISNVTDPTKNNFEIDLFLVEDFCTGKKNFRNYDIEYFFNLSKGIFTEEEIAEESKKSGALLYMIPHVVTDNNEITFYHDPVAEKWKVSARKNINEKLDIMPISMVYVTKHGDPHYLYNSFSIDPRDLKNGPKEFNFLYEKDLELNSISLFTQKKFKTYGIRITNDRQD